ncbi:proprotein convertase P-domain-containing protein [Myxococcus sp. RHSTA-1-4]|uniref:proprotein convertase P-domain-containing protein n=1 Tax=Myxococcus sp. RHSTA-1-4 TaxID=2874601 RepID=UPI001CBD68E3|nr:proprotein convertase P-domain-containing protein [Myxococcus sp. RHSTA-1-4]MBZ4415774.1 proprotein convertase P-domain-containing protein [Myxococcus sp. RHSTA-1-4]
MTSRSFFLAMSMGLPVLLSCGAPASGEPVGASVMVSQSQALADGTPASTGVLAFLNDRSTTLAVLDTEVPLEVRAAQGLIAWRAGPDGVENTADDRRFVSIAQVDAVPYVGPAALADLEWYARGTGRVAELPLDALVGNFDGHAFTLAEARRTLRAANTETAATLQNGYGIAPLAVQDILAARPIAHMVELSRLAHVDSTVLQRFKLNTALAPEGDPCTGAGTCQPGLVCEGVPHDGSSPYGRCINPAPIPGDGATCSVFAPCQPGLVCRGIPSGAPEGWCRPAWMAGEFIQYADVSLPSSATPVESTVAVVGLATVPDDITVELDLVHASPHRLVLTLVDPGGDSALLWDGPNEGTPPSRISVTRGISRDSTVNGRWLLRVTNPSGVGSGTLRSWKLKLNSRYD